MEDNKKPKLNIISFTIGLLVGAIISTGSIFFYTLAANTNADNSSTQQSMQAPGTPPNGENGGGTPPSGAPNNSAQSN